MRTSFWALGFIVVLSLTGCSKKSSNPSPTGGKTGPAADSSFAKGADVSWLTQMEASGYKFYNSSGTAMDCMKLLQSLGVNSIRLRAWVNPAAGWCNTTDLVAKAMRAHQLGMRILIDFHYSDTWADPGDQNKPAAWASYNFPTLSNTVYSYTVGVLDTLKANGVVPSWVQIGNETNDGMLWQDGRASVSMANFAALVTSGYKAVKSISDTIQVIVHVSNGFDNSLFRYVFDGLSANGAQFDIIGMSLYPTAANWQTSNTSCLANMNDMVSRYNKKVMICEVGMPENDPTDCQSFLTDLISKTKSVTGNNGLGVFYWEPESYNGWQGYGLGAFDDTGKPTTALNAFAN